MREIKFRFWDSNKKQMLYHDEWSSKGTNMTWTGRIYEDGVLQKQMIPEQYTGLKDKNGVEIYEGDIVRITDLTAFEMFGGDSPIMKAYTRNWTVFWGDVGFTVKYCDSDFDFTSDIIHDLATTGVEYEIIGNIH